MRILLRLFWELFRISLFVVGGGYAIIVVADDVFARRGWTKEGEVVGQLPVFQMVPGIIATHVAVYVGSKVAGRIGAAVGVAAVALPSVVIFTFVSMGYDSLPLGNPWLASAFTGLRAALAGVVAAAVIRGWRRNVDGVFAYAVVVAAVAAIGFFGVAVPLVILAAMALGLAVPEAGASAAPGQGGGRPPRRFRSSWLPLLLFLKYGALCFGGGFVLVPMYVQDFVGPGAAFLQISSEEFANLMALTQMTPGPIGVNGATFFGYRLAGVPGAALASAALLLPGSLVLYFVLRSLERFRENRVVRGIMRGARPASVALMLCALWAFGSMCWWRVESSGGILYNPTTMTITAAVTALMTLRKPNVMILIFACALFAAAARAGALPADVTPERFPDADAVLLDEVEHTEYNPDGTYDLTDEYWTKILTEKGRRGESSISLRYSRRYGEAGIVFVEAIGEDGKVRAIDVAATTSDTTDNSSMSANIYDPLDRKIVCTVPGLKVGDVVHVKTRRRMSKPRCEGKWAEIAVMEWSMPILRSTFEVVAPPSRPLRKIAIRHPLGNMVTNVVARADGSTLYAFTVTNAPQAFPEPDMPPLYTQVQNVRVSTAEDWHEISRWYWELCAPHISKTNAALCAKAEEIGHDLRAMFKFVSQEIRYMGLTMEDTSPGYSPHDVDVTFDNRYGVCRDKAALLVAMLRHVGFNAFPVLIHVGAKMDPEVPQPYFNHAVVAVERTGNGERGTGNGERYILMDPTDENAKDIFPAYLSDKSYLVCRPEGDDLRTSPVPSPERNSLDVESRGTLSADGSVFLESEVRFGGINDTAYRHAFVQKQPVDRVKVVERIVKSVAPGAELVRCEIEPRDMRDTESPLRVSLAARMPEAVLRGETRDELAVPFLSKALGMANFLLSGSTSLAQRKYPLVLGSTARVTETVRLDLGDELGAAESLPSEDPGSMPGYGYARTFSVSNGTLVAKRSLTIGAVEFAPKEYGDLREEIKRVEAAERRRPVFARDPLRDADVRYLLDSSETSVHSDRAWTVTNTVVKEVLTYAGKKDSAELKIGFNPTVESVELLYATVSNRNGEVRHVTDKERNMMDCGWAAAAPRYPAGKVLVVNLPSVEIGSVISYTTVCAVTNAPAPFYAAYLFDSRSPLDRRVVRVNGWRREAVRPKRVPREASQPAATLWRDIVFVSSNRFETIDLSVGSVDPEGVVWTAADRPAGGEERLRAVRDWMAKYVKVAGPGLYELPIEAQLTPPETVLRERYATRLDYMRTMCSLLRGAGLDADVVLSSSDADETEVVRRRIKHEQPNVRAFSSALCRVTLREGGFLWFGGEEKTYFVGTENQYSPLGPSSYEGSDYFDPSTGEFGVVTVPDPSFASYGRETAEYDIRPDGSVDLTAVNEFFGPGVGSFRKKYAEILPEDRSRLHQEILGAVAQAATATSDLEADVSSYPARRKFSCYIPDFATVQDNAITIQVPPMAAAVPSFTGNARKTPFAIGAASRATEVVTVVFPEGYGKIEHLPTPFEFADPDDPGKIWLESLVKTEMRDGRLAVTIRREVHKRGESWYRPEMYELLKDWRRIASSRANRTITVKKN